MSNKMHLKKILPIIAGMGIVAASASSLVACTAPQYAAGVDGQRVMVVTDGGRVNDHSFNQDAYDGVKNFVANAFVETHQVKQEDGSFKEETVKVQKVDEKGKPVVDKDGNPVMVDKRLDGSNNYVEAGGTDSTSIVSGYALSIVKKANAIVLPGFAHVNTLGQAEQFLQKHNINVVLVDGFYDAPNVISIQFDSQIAGVMAGFDSSYKLATTYAKDKDGNVIKKDIKDKDGNVIKRVPVLKYDTNGDNKIKIGTFAGAQNKYGVDNYMWGLLVGMDLYNREADKHNKGLDDTSDQYWTKVETANSVAKGRDSVNDGIIENIKTVSNTDPNWYTNSFAKGGATSTGLPGKLIDGNKADVIFPVAGPQIEDVLSYKPTGDGARAPYVIGVDVDQSSEYVTGDKNTGDPGRFVTSAIKNIDTAVPEALYRASDDEGKGNTLKYHEPFDKQENSKYGDFSKKGAVDKQTGNESNSQSANWLGKQFGNQLKPFVDWSIDFAGDGPLGGKYILDKHAIKLYTDDGSNGKNPAMYKAPDDSVMAVINAYFRSPDLGGTNGDSMSYMDGQKIKKLVDAIEKAIGDKTWTDDSLDLSNIKMDTTGLIPAPAKGGADHE